MYLPINRTLSTASDNNLIAYNGIGIRFLNPWHGNEFRNNNFAGNLTQVAVGGRGNAR